MQTGSGRSLTLVISSTAELKCDEWMAVTSEKPGLARLWSSDASFDPLSAQRQSSGLQEMFLFWSSRFEARQSQEHDPAGGELAALLSWLKGPLKSRRMFVKFPLRLKKKNSRQLLWRGRIVFLCYFTFWWIQPSQSELMNQFNTILFKLDRSFK